MGDHGTTTAAIALASANDECSRGIAYGAGLSKCSFRTNSNEENLLFAFSDYALQTNAVSSNSWGIPPCLSHERLRQNKMACPFRPVAATSPDPRFPSPCEVCTSWVPGSCDSRIQRYCSHPSNYETDPECAAWTHLWMQCSFQHLDPTTVTYFMRGVHTGRGGLGTVYVFAAGNGHGGGDDINQMGYQHDRFTITTGATDKFGRHSYYSTTGASLFISAPGGDAYDHANGGGERRRLRGPGARDVVRVSRRVGRRGAYARGGTAAHVPRRSGYPRPDVLHDGSGRRGLDHE